MKSPLMKNVEHRHGDSIENLIRRQVEKGRTQEETAEFLGVSYWTYRKWLYRLGANVEQTVRFASEEASLAAN